MTRSAPVIDVKGVMFDGSTRVLGACETDLRDPPLAPNQRRDCESKFSEPPIGLPVSIAITPVYAVLDGCTLMGDRDTALRGFFAPQRAAADVYSRYLADLKAIGKSSPGALREALEKYVKGYQVPTTVVQSYAANSPASRAAKSASNQVISLLLTQLRNNAANVAPEKLLQEHIALVQGILDNATKYSAPK